MRWKTSRACVEVRSASPMFMLHPGVLFAIALSLTFNGCGPKSENIVASEPHDLLERSAAALRDVTAVAYDFEWGSNENPAGWVTGHTLMRQVSDVDDSWIRTRGTVHEQPTFGVEEIVFDYTLDGERAWARNGAESRWQTAPVGNGANSLAIQGVFGYLPEFVEATPFWKELGPLATAVLLEPEVVDGETCDVIEVRIPLESGPPSVTIWSIARSDRLPRRGVWPVNAATPPMVFTLTALEVEPSLTRSDFQIDTVLTESGTAPVRRAAAPPFALATSEGRTVTRSDLTGQVTVLDFWNTWCYLCRIMAPETRQLAGHFADQPVQFFGVNVFETGDPTAYWREAGNPYPTLLEGDELADDLDLPWQPGLAVIGHGGDVLWKQLGASPDRAEKIKVAIETGLAQLGTSASSSAP